MKYLLILIIQTGVAFIQYCILDGLNNKDLSWGFWEGMLILSLIYLIPTVSMIILFVSLKVKNSPKLAAFGLIITILFPAIATLTSVFKYMSNTGEFFLGLLIVIILGFVYVIIGLGLPYFISVYWLGDFLHNGIRDYTTSEKSHVTINKTTGILYSGSGWTREEIGSYENGIIYRGTGWTREELGSYENGIIYRGTGWTREELGSHENGIIYKGTGWTREELGSYENGTIYKGTGLAREELGSYEGVADGAAAAAFLLLLY